MPADQGRLRYPRALVFAANFCMMLVQVVSGRMLAPYLGVSIYTWTSVIGCTLLGMTCGYYVGGYLADKRRSRIAIGMCLALAGIALLIVNYGTPLVGVLLAGTNAPIFMRTFFFAMFGMAPVSFLLAAVTPQVVKLGLQDLGKAGETYGSIGAYGAAGSILGTFVAGFFLISFFGTKTVLSLTSILLLGLGLATAWPYPMWRTSVAGVVALFLVGDFFVPGICRMETNYFCIRIKEATDTDGSPAYTLRLDHLVHSYVTPNNPGHLGYEYEHVYTNLVASRHGKEGVFQSLFIGGGGYVMPRYLQAYYASSSQVVAEIDPGVTVANERFMGLPTSTRIVTKNMDARMYLKSLPEDGDQKFEFVFGDAFNDFSVPFHLTTVEFHQLLKQHMTPNGVYALNIIDDARYGQFLSSMVRTLQTVWKHVYVAPQNEKIVEGRNTIILLATDEAIDRDAWGKVTVPYEYVETRMKRDKAIHLLSDDEVAAFLEGHPAPALVDDFVPTDRYLAPVFGDAY